MSKRNLIERWQSADGQRQADAVVSILLEHDSRTWGKRACELEMDRGLASQLKSVLVKLEFADEVLPAIDLRGFDSKRPLHIRSVELTNARFDYVSLHGHFAGCAMAGTVFNGATARGLTFGHDLRNSSFIAADFKDSYFGDSLLDGANFSEAKLQCAKFNGASCRGACFVNAKMKFAHCPKADFRGADLSCADLREAVLGSAKFDAETNLDGTILIGARMTKDNADFVRKAGAIVGPDESSYELTQLEAAKTLLERENGDGSLSAVLERLPDLRERIRKTPTLDWLAELQEGQTPEIAANLEYIYEQAGKMISQFAD